MKGEKLIKGNHPNNTKRFNVSTYSQESLPVQIVPNHNLKVHLCRFENLPTCLCSYKNNTLKISHY